MLSRLLHLRLLPLCVCVVFGGAACLAATPAARIPTSSTPTSTEIHAVSRSVVDTRGRVRDDVHFTARVGEAVVHFRTGGVSLVFERRKRTHAHDDGHQCVPRPDTGAVTLWRADLVAPAADAHTIPVRDGAGRIVYPAHAAGVDLVCTVEGGERLVWQLVDAAGRVRPTRPEVLGATLAGSTLHTPFGGMELVAGDATTAHPGGIVPVRTQILPHLAAHTDSPSGRILAPYTAGGARIPFANTPTLRWSTYLGGTGDDVVTGTAVTRDGAVVVTGWSRSAVLPVSTGAAQPAPAGLTDAYVARFTADGTREWLTFFGGRDDDRAMDVAVDDAGRVAIIGTTKSDDLPARGVSTLLGRNDAFVAIFDAGGALFRSWYIGGTLEDEGHAVTFTRTGDLVVTGTTMSADIPVTFNLLQNFNRGGGDLFIAAFRTDGTRVWSTYYGGAKEDWPHAVHEDRDGNLYISGHTESENSFPVTPGVFQPTNNNMASPRDGFLLKLHPTGQRIFSTFIGGNDWDDAYDVKTDSAGVVIVAGATASRDFPVTPGAYDVTLDGTNTDAFVMTVDSTGNALRWSTYFGGNRRDLINGIAVLLRGTFYVTGVTESTDLPVTPDAMQPALAGGSRQDAFIVRFTRDGHPDYSSYLGGTQGDNIEAFDRLATASAGRTGTVVFGGWTRSTDFPVTPGAFQQNAEGSDDGFLTVFGCAPAPAIVVAEGPTSFCLGDSVRLNAPPGYAYYEWSDGSRDASIIVRTPGVYSVFVIDTNDCGAASNELSVTVFAPPAPRIAALGDTVLCDGDSVTLDAGAGYARHLWSTGDTTRTIRVGVSMNVSVEVIDANGCWGVSAPMRVVVNPRPSTVITASGPLAFCDGGIVVLDAGAGFASQQWTTGETTRTITVRASGSYGVTVTNVFGCAFDAAPVAVTVLPHPPAVISASGPVTFCEGDSVVLSAPAGSYTWRWSTGETTQSIVVRSSTSGVTVTVADANGCDSTSAPVSVTMNPLPRPVITATRPTSFCAGDSVVLDAGAGFTSYAWSTGETSRTIVVRQSATVRVTVQFATGCAGTSPDVAIVVHPDPQPVVMPAGPVALCDGDSVTLRAPAGFLRYTWSTGETTADIVVRAGGVYRVTVEDANGCAWTSPDVPVTVYPLPVRPVIVQLRDTLVSTPEAAYQWLLEGQPLSGETAQRLLFPRSGTYTVLVTSSDGCSRMSDPISVTIARTVVRIPELVAAPGETVVVPLELVSSEGLALSGARTFTATVRVAKSIFAPDPPVAAWTDLGTERSIALTGTWPDTTGVLATFSGLAMLGAVEQIPLDIVDFAWIEGSVRVTTIDGSLRLLVCEEGGVRLYDANGVQGIRAAAPNPFNAMSVLTWSVIERAPARLVVMDALGREVAVLHDRHTEPGTYTSVFDATALPSGMYHAVLVAGTGVSFTRLLLVK
jgi:hypothetical protein